MNRTTSLAARLKKIENRSGLDTAVLFFANGSSVSVPIKRFGLPLMCRIMDIGYHRLMGDSVTPDPLDRTIELLARSTRATGKGKTAESLRLLAIDALTREISDEDRAAAEEWRAKHSIVKSGGRPEVPATQPTENANGSSAEPDRL